MTPNEVTVPAGEMIEFHFYAGAHSVAQSSFDKPCEPLVNGTTVGFFSGPQQVAAGAMGANVFRVKSTGSPMWFYCATQRHCQSGMVGVINKPAARTIAQYAAAAARAPNNVAPAAVGGGDLAAANGATPTGSGPGATDRPNGAGAGFFGQLSMPVLGFAAAVAAIGGLAL
jgi:plastocyanin